MDNVQLLALLPEEHREGASKFLESLNPLTGVDSKEKALEFVEGNQIFKSAFDSKVTNSIQTFKENDQERVNNLLKEKEEEVTKTLTAQFQPTLTPEQQRIKDLEDKLNQSDADRVRDKQLLFAKDYVKGKIYDGFDVDPYLGKTDIETQNLIDKAVSPYTEHYNKGLEALSQAVETEVNKRLNGTAAPEGNNDNPPPQPKVGKTVIDTLHLATARAKAEQ